MKRRSVWMSAAAFVLIAHSITAAADRQAADRVSQGIRQHRAGQFEQAAESFAGAQKILPEDRRIAFDRGCALAAQGETEAAREQLRSATLTRDTTLASAAYYNLGGLSVGEAKQLFGEHPEEATEEVRPEGLSLLADAVQQYRACLRIEPDHQEARHNLELLRLWVKQMQDVWARRDRERRRNETSLLEFLLLIWDEQKEIRATTRRLGEEAGSPQLRRAVTMVQQQQELLIEEMDPLLEKLLAEVGEAGATEPDKGEQIKSLLSAMVAEARAAMARADGDLSVNELLGAVSAQTESLGGLDELYRVIATFESVLRRAIENQERLVAVTNGQLDSVVAVDESLAEKSIVDPAAIAEEQQWVGGWSAVLAPKAEQSLQGLPLDQPAREEGDDPNGSPTDPNGEAQQAAARAGYEKAIELGPRVTQLIADSVDHLKHPRWAEAAPLQQESLKLLKEIAETLPKQEPPPDEQNEDKKEQEQNKDDNGNSDNQEKKPEDQEDSNKDEQQPPKPDSDDKQKQDKQNKQKKQEQQRDLNREQAEALLKQVREREREHRDRQKELRRLIRRGIKVDKDW